MTAPSKTKRRGRPPISAEPGQRFMIHLPPEIADRLRKLGSGSLSRGVLRQALGDAAASPAPLTIRARRARDRAQRALDQVNEQLNQKIGGGK